MKRSVNLSAPRRYRLLAALRGANCAPLDAEPLRPDAQQRIAKYSETLRRASIEAKDRLVADARADLADHLDTLPNMITKTAPYMRLAHMILEAYDLGWRIGGKGKIKDPAGNEKGASEFFRNIFAAIDLAEGLAKKG